VTLRDPSQAAIYVTAKVQADGKVITRVKHKAKIDGVRTVKYGASETHPNLEAGRKAVDVMVAEFIKLGWSKSTRVVGTRGADSFDLSSLPKPNMTPAKPTPPAPKAEKAPKK
jgi:hypothetical protein